MFDDKVVLVTGASRRIGRCYALSLAKSGANVVALARTLGDSPDQFGTLLAMGVVIWFATQAFFNIGGVTRTIPLTGIPLPLISFGSSALVATLAAGEPHIEERRYRRHLSSLRLKKHRRHKTTVGVAA